MDDVLAGRLETRVRDGLSLSEASNKAFSEAKELERSYGWIALDKNRHWAVATTTEFMSFAVITLKGTVLNTSQTHGSDPSST